MRWSKLKTGLKNFSLLVTIISLMACSTIRRLTNNHPEQHKLSYDEKERARIAAGGLPKCSMDETLCLNWDRDNENFAKKFQNSKLKPGLPPKCTIAADKMRLDETGHIKPCIPMKFHYYYPELDLPEENYGDVWIDGIPYPVEPGP